MKILHTSDWHLGKRLENYPRHAEQIEVLDEICQVANSEQVHAVIIAGDLFDAYNPPVESTELFFKTLKRLSYNGRRAVIAIAGNHDSPDRIEAPDPLARECGIIFAGYPYSHIPAFELETGLKVIESDEGFISLQLPGVIEPLRMILTPYANEFRLKAYLGNENTEEEQRTLLGNKWKYLADKYCDTKGVNILVSHLLMVRNDHEIPEEPDDERPIFHVGGATAIYTRNIPEQIQYVAMGHLHQIRDVKGDATVTYCGSPLTYSFNETNPQKSVLIIDVTAGNRPKVNEVNLKRGKKLLRKKAESIEEAIQWLVANPDCLVELTMATETFLTAEDRRRLYASHDGIVSLIPEVKNASQFWCPPTHHIDLAQNMENLFIDYFTHSKGQAPDETILSLFKEALASDEENSSEGP